MNIMNMPGFTAETSLYKTSGHYRMAGTPGDLLGSREVLPQLPIGFCMADCEFTHPNDSILREHCKLGCLEGGDPRGPIVISEPPEPRCGPCIGGRARCGIPGRGFVSVPCSVEPE